MASTYTLDPDPDVIELLRSLAPGSVVAQLDDGSLAVCADVADALRRFDEQSQSPRAPLKRPVAADRGWSSGWSKRPVAADRGWTRLAATLNR